MTAYRSLFRVDLRHDFFGDGLCRGLVFNAAPETAALLRNRGLLLRTAPSGMSVFVGDDQPPVEEKAAAEPLVFTFKIAATDAGFSNYTVLDGTRDTVFVFDSERAQTVADCHGLRLHQNACASADDRIDLNAPALSTLLEGRDPGMDDCVPISRPLAVVAVRLSASDLIANGRERSYYVRFGARSLHWKYYILTAPGTDASLSILDAAGVIGFDPIGAIRLPGNRQAMAFRSKDPIVMSERPRHSLELRADRYGQRPLVKRLPVASPHHLGKDTIQGHDVVVSEIYINL